LYWYGAARSKPKIQIKAAILAQAGILGWIISSVYKAFTGRIQPEFLTYTSLEDISRNFNFGFWEHGIFWGWPSSHTSVAFAMSVALIMLYPRNKVLAVLALAYAFFIGVGVSVSVHWFSDFVAGAIIGTIVGLAVTHPAKQK
jgi:membrane-associated phospholipid phosphatase